MMMRRFASLLVLLVAGCGGKSGTLTLQLVVSPGDDPFVDAAQVRFTVGNAKHVTTVPASMGHFSYKTAFQPDNMPGTVTVDALDAQGNVVAHGQTPALTLTAVDQGPVAIWMGRPGRVAPAPAALPSARAELASAAILGLGVLYAGGRDSSGAVLADTAVYDVYTQGVIATAAMQKPRAGGVAAPVSGVHAIVFGGATSAGFGTSSATDGTMELFDPTVGVGVWASLPVDPIGGRAYAAGTTLGSGSILVSGGVDMTGAAQPTAGLVNPSGAIKLTLIASPMAAARVGHAVAPAHFPDGDGALLFGGLAPGSTGGAVAERLVGQTFSAYDVGTAENRINATATTMPSGDILVLGGKTRAGAVASGLVVSPTAPGASVSPLAGALSVAREGHTATLVGTELLVCGGADAKGALQASCDVLDAMTYGLKRTVPLATARRGQSAELLETHLVILAGGFGADGAPLASIEIYTPGP